MNDWELLQDWAGNRSDAAFAELVRRHLNLVYAAARRQVIDSELARDVSQAVFLALAHKAGSLPRNVILGGWLIRTTRFVATRALRTEYRRQRRETAATLMDSLTSAVPTIPEHWSEVEPQLDAALAGLSNGDRDLVVLRFFERKSMAEVGRQLGIGEDTAKKRVSRAVERLRVMLTKRGVVLTLAGLTLLLSQLPTAAAPVGFADTITATATTQTAPGPVTLLTQAALRDWFLVSLRCLLPWAAAVTVCLSLATAQWLSAASRTNPRGLVVETNRPSVGVVASPTTPIPPAIEAAQPEPPGKVVASKILLSVRTIDGSRPLAAKLRVVRFAPHGLIGATDTTTDLNGIAEIPITEPDIWLVSVWVSAAGHVPVVCRWNRHEFVQPVLLQTCRLEPGHVLGGVVVDERQNSVEGATVEIAYQAQNRLDRQEIAFNPLLSGVKTDAAGRFMFDQVPANFENDGGKFVVKHPNYLWHRVPLNSSADVRTNHVVTLSGGAMISGLITDQNGNPIANAEIRQDNQVASAHPVEFAKTDSTGAFVLGRFRPGPLPIEVSAENHEARRQTIEVSRTDQHLTLALSASSSDNAPVRKDESPPTVRITGTVVDDESGEAIPSFTVRFGEPRSSVTGLIGEGHDGRFDWPVSLWNFRSFSLEFEALGYAVASSDLRGAEQAEQQFAIRLQRSSEVSGRVVYPDGKPATGAFVILNLFEDSYWLYSGKPNGGMHCPRTTTDVQGRFALKMHPLAVRLLVVAEEGCSQWIVDQPRQDTLVLQPWGTIEGVVMLQGKPAANETVVLWPGPALEAGGVSGIEQQQTVVTDAEGHFRFERVAASPVRVDHVKRRPDGSTTTAHRQRIEALPGQTVQVQLGGTGSTIIGRLELSQPIPDFDWQTAPQYLIAKMDFPPLPQSGPPGTRAHIAYMNEQVRRNDLRLPLGLPLAPDGRFRIEDVPAGDYQLLVKVLPPPTGSVPKDDHERLRALSRRMLPHLIMGGLTNEVIVPIESDGPIDLGTLVVPVRQ